MNIKSLVIAVSATLFCITGCAKPPVQELNTAKAALDTARVMEADKYVAASYSAAQDSLNAAIAEIEKQKSGNALTSNYDRAKALLASATATAQSARAQAQTEKLKVQAEVDTSLTKATGLVTETKDLLSKAPKGKEGKAALEAIGNEISTVEMSLGEAQKERTDNNLMDARDKANAGIAQLDSIKGELTNAIAKTAKKTSPTKSTKHKKK